MDHLIWRDQPELKSPILVAAFEGWNDAAEAASDAAVWLVRRFNATAIAGIDPEAFVNFQEHRPRIVIQDGNARHIAWPGNEFYAAHVPDAEHDIVVLVGIEPSMRWQTFCDTVIEAVEAFGCSEVVTFGSLLADIPHTRDPYITGMTTRAEPLDAPDVRASSYEGPTGIVGVLHDTFRKAGITATSLWVPVPHYVASPPNPLAIRALIQHFDRIAGYNFDYRELDVLADAWRQQVSEMVAEDEEARDYVASLEADAAEEALTETEIPSGDAIAADFERYLRDQDS